MNDIDTTFHHMIELKERYDTALNRIKSVYDYDFLTSEDKENIIKHYAEIKAKMLLYITYEGDVKKKLPEGLDEVFKLFEEEEDKFNFMYFFLDMESDASEGYAGPLPKYRKLKYQI
eukprot:TRINITY_DN19787_c0_g1_i1.p1 TRINITY_DN19787_c0_g1~~TRINITY_DN19787_c0_g1_i1.p1  ORF type:complete len:117 (-),score=11.26 TRINITY_DN19787_c0_g1_i1:140-490(-)